MQLNVNDTFQLRHDSGKPIKDVVISRPGVIELKVLEEGEKNTTLVGKALTPGLTTLAISAYDDDTVTRKTIQVIPDVKYIEALIAKTFPTSSIRIIPGSAANSLIATGSVESAEDVRPVMTFLSAFTGNDVRRVTNALRVSGSMTVQLEVCVARVQRSELRAMGMNFLFADRQNFLTNGIGGGGLTNVTTAAQAGRTPPTLGSATAFTTLMEGIQGAATPSIQFGITDSASGFVGFLQALRQESLAKTIANPVLVTTSGRVAEFLVGGEAAAAVSGGAASGSTLSYRAFGTRLAFLPFVLGDGRIRLDVLTEVSQPAGAAIVTPNIVAPNFIVNRVHTVVEMENRQSLILGGIIQNEVSATTNKVPVLGDLPFVGVAFRASQFQESETELVIMVTVSLVDPLDAGQVAGYRLPGTETRSPSDFEFYLEGIMEAPRGPRDPFPGNRYQAAHKLAAPYGVPQGHCWPDGSCGYGVCGSNYGCAVYGNGNHGTSVVVPAMHQPTMPVQQMPAPSSLTTMPMPVAPMPGTPTSGLTPPALPTGSRSMVLPQEIVPVAGFPQELPPVDPPVPLEENMPVMPPPTELPALPPVQSEPPAPPAPPSGPQD